MSWVGQAARRGMVFGNNGKVTFNGELFARNLSSPSGRVYYVDNTASSSLGGTSWDRPFTTIQEAITASNATIDWAASNWLVDNWIFIAPGTYAENLTPAYSCHLVGLGQPGTDQAVEIHPATGDCLAGTGLGLHMYNIRLEVTDASECCDFGICNGVTLEECAFVCGIAGTGTNAISTENSDHLRVLNCRFEHGATDGWDYGIYAAGGADKYLHHAEIRGNIIQGLGATGTGIYIASNCTASNAVIAENYILITGAGTGIDDDSDDAWVLDNTIIIGGAGTHIDSNAAKTLGNLTYVNGTTAAVPVVPSV